MKDTTMIFFSSLRWSSLFQRHQQLASRLASNHEVFFIEPTFSFLALGRNDNLRYLLKSFRKPYAVQPKLQVVTGPLVLPFRNKSTLVNDFNQWLLTRWVRKRLKGKIKGNVILWISSPSEYKQLGRWSEAISCYDCFDEHTEWKQAIDKSKVDFMEEQLFRNTDVVFATAELLVEKARKYRDKVVYLPNAVDENIFSTAVPDTNLEPAILAAIKAKRPIIGYVGHLSDWLDHELVKKCVAQMPEALFVFVGPTEGPVPAKLVGIKNILLTGRREVFLMPAYINTFDVCTIPFEVNELTIKVNPLKVYEYLAQGKPVVATALPELNKIRHLVDVASNHEDYIKALKEKIMDSGDKKTIEARINYSRENTWSERIAEVERNIKELMESNRMVNSKGK